MSFDDNVAATEAISSDKSIISIVRNEKVEEMFKVVMSRTRYRVIPHSIVA